MSNSYYSVSLQCSGCKLSLLLPLWETKGWRGAVSEPGFHPLPHPRGMAISWEGQQSKDRRRSQLPFPHLCSSPVR